MKNLKFIGHVNEEFRNLVANSHSGHITWEGQDLYIEVIKGTLERLPLELLVAVNIDTYHDNSITLTSGYKGYTFNFTNYGYGKQKKLSFYVYDNRYSHNTVTTALAQVNKEELLNTPNFFKAPKLDKLKKGLDMCIEAYEITKKYVDTNKKGYDTIKDIFINAGFNHWRNRFTKDVKLSEFITLHLVIEMDENNKYFFIVNSHNSGVNFSVNSDDYVTKAKRIAEFVYDAEEKYKKEMGL